MEIDTLPINKDVKFVEDIFPFMFEQSNSRNLLIDKHVGVIENTCSLQIMNQYDPTISDEGN